MTQILMSPLKVVFSSVVFGTPPNSINRMPRFISSFPRLQNKMKESINGGKYSNNSIIASTRKVIPWMVGNKLDIIFWYKFLSLLMLYTFSHSKAVICFLMASAVMSSHLMSLPPNCKDVNISNKTTRPEMVSTSIM